MQINSHLSVLVHNLAKKWGEKTALTFRKFGSDQWQSVSFNLFSLRVKQVSNALLNLGAKPLDKSLSSRRTVCIICTPTSVRMVSGLPLCLSMPTAASSRFNI